MKKFISPIVIILIIVAGYSYLTKDKESEEDTEPQIEYVKPERGSVVHSVSSSGRVVAHLDVEIKCKASGEVISLPFDISAIVTRGELVVELDPIDEKRNVQISEVSLTSSQARYKKAEQNLLIAETDLENARWQANVNLESTRVRAEDARAKADRMKKLYEQELAGEEEWETAETSAIRAEADLESSMIAIEDLKTDEAALELRRQDVLLAKMDMESAKINLDQANQRLTDTKVYAPIDGVVTSREVQTGQIISSGISNTSGGTPILTLSDLTRLYILASVDESDIGNIKPGMPAMISADAFMGTMFRGTVERIAQKGVNSSNVVTFEVRIEVTSENKSLLKPEMTADVEVVVARADDALTLPSGAISRVKGKYIVTIQKKDGTEEEREVVVGLNNGMQVEIIEGLTEEDTVVIKQGAGFSPWSRGGSSRPNSPSRMMGTSGRGRH